MKKIAILTAAGVLGFAAPAFADDDSTATSTPSAQEQCRTERTQMGKELFAQTYGTNKNRANAFGKCVSKRSAKTEKAEKSARTGANAACRAERDADPAAFTKKYGTGKKGANAFGKCVSGKAKAMKAAEVDAQVDDDVSAAKSCRAERTADPAGFRAKYGTNKNRANAFGKCVSAKAKAAADARRAEAQQQS